MDDEIQASGEQIRNAFQAVFGYDIEHCPRGNGRMTPKEHEINEWLLERGFNPLPMSDPDIGRSITEGYKIWNEKQSSKRIAALKARLEGQNGDNE